MVPVAATGKVVGKIIEANSIDYPAPTLISCGNLCQEAEEDAVQLFQQCKYIS